MNPSDARRTSAQPTAAGDRGTPEPPGPTGGVPDLDLATDQLRARPSELPPEVAARVLRRALAAPRRGQLVRARGAAQDLRVSTTALVALLRRDLDEGLPHGAVNRLTCGVGRDEDLEEVTVELVAAYGHDVRLLAAEARVLAHRAIVRSLGPPSGTGATSLVHVHVVDVTVGDPHLVGPADEG